jgi:DNA-binding response OmpR family regulator
MRLLQVEDDAPLAASIAGVLSAKGWRVDIDSRASTATGRCVVSGAQGSLLPILMLTARDAAEERVNGLEIGADDHMVRPFAITQSTTTRSRLRYRDTHREYADRLNWNLRMRAAPRMLRAQNPMR